MGVARRRMLELADGEQADRLALSLIESRFRPPLPRLRLVRRESVLFRLDNGSAPLIVIAAPGGFGKTITLAQWVRTEARPVAWLQADEADDDALLFLTYLASALDDIVEIDRRVWSWLRLAPPPVTTRILPAIAGAVAAAEPFLFVIDDVHLVSNPACWRMINLVIDQSPPGSQVCLAGRVEPLLPLARLRAEGRLLELGPRELAFTSREIDQLLALQGAPADSATVARLAELTDGWAAGLYLAVLAGSEVPGHDWLASIRGDRHGIARYLATEVLHRETPEMRRFLLQTSILERLSLGLCRVVTENPRAGELLQRAARDNLFVTALDDADEWFRYHHLFAEFLMAELARGNESEVRALHARAAAWFEAHGAPDEAVRHWLAAGDARRAGLIVCCAHADYSSRSRHETIRRWLEMFSDEQILADPALTIIAGNSTPMTGDSRPRARRWLTAALLLKPGDDVMPGTNMPLGALHAILVGELALGGVSQMRRCGEEAVLLSRSGDLTVQAAAEVLLGQALWLAGDSTRAEPHLRAGEEAGAVAHCLMQITAIGLQALSLADQGRWKEARAKMAAGLARFGDAGLRWAPPHFPLLLAQVRLEAHDRGPDVTGLVAEVADFIGYPEIGPFPVLTSQVMVAEALADCGDVDAAEPWVRDGLATLATYPDAGMLGGRLLRLRGLLEQRQLVEPLTTAERRILELLPSELSEKEIARRLLVSPETVHSHVAAVYRKLDVHVRSEAVEKARSLGLLGS